ncbi:MAG TPA: fumarylacetoacetate hydrolase family protein [Nitrososphaerales archaeon]|nr:fumarylacetoacetate hydrolase family protein [Nitrososphaerales archaeon]
MRLCTYLSRRDPSLGSRVGILEDEGVTQVNGIATMLEALSAPRIGSIERGRRVKESDVRLCAPIQRPGKIVAAIVNTAGMLGGEDVTLERPRMDMKAPSTVIGPQRVVFAPRSGVRPEVELAVVVGKRSVRLSKKGAEEAIFGYTILNDVTAPLDSKEDAYDAYRRDKTTGLIRKVTMRGPLFRSKNHDTFCPMGPCLVTKDELDVADLGMRTEFLGRKVQEGNTSEYIFSPRELVSYVSGFLSLDPGDVVSCGSVGWTREAIGDYDPTEYLLPKKNGTMKLSVDGLGVLTNPLRYQ